MNPVANRDLARISLICKPLPSVSHGRATGSIPVPPTISKARRRQQAYGRPAQSAEPVSSNGLNSLIPGRRKSFSFPVATVKLCRIAIEAMQLSSTGIG